MPTKPEYTRDSFLAIHFDVINFVTYTNYKGEMALRTITPEMIWFGTTDIHTTPRWLLDCYDHDKQAHRTFALDSIQIPAKKDTKKGSKDAIS